MTLRAHFKVNWAPLALSCLRPHHFEDHRLIRFNTPLAMTLCLCLSLSPRATEEAVSTAIDGWNFALTPGALSDQCSQALGQAREALATLEQDTAPATLHYDGKTITILAEADDASVAVKLTGKLTTKRALCFV